MRYAAATNTHDNELHCAAIAALTIITTQRSFRFIHQMAAPL
jgi:hypothetical protein